MSAQGQMEVMVLLEAALRGGALALLALLATMSLPAVRVSAAARYGALFALSVAAYVIDSAPWPAIQHAAWIIPIRLASIGTPAVFWQWAAAHFDDDFVPDWRRWLVWFGLVGLGAVAIVIDRAIVWHAVQSAALVLAGLGFWRVLSGRRLDLIEDRRRLRVYLAIGAALYIAAANLCFLLPNWFQLWWHGSAVNAGGLAAISFVFAVQRLLSERDEFTLVGAPALAATPAVANQFSTAAVDGSEAAWLAALRAAMERDKVYRGEGFTIAALAARVGIPEYRLRRLINQRLGHRNFTAFVNSYRLAEVTAALSDPSQDDVSILTIALDSGFQSLGPFNRAFKIEFGLTPTEFRREAAIRRRSAAE
jgi:AraC-like DNA-binding protein